MERIKNIIKSTNSSRLLNDLLFCVGADKDIRHRLRLKSHNESKRTIILNAINNPDNLKAIADFLYSKEYGSDADNDDILALSSYDTEIYRNACERIRINDTELGHKNNFHPR